MAHFGESSQERLDTCHRDIKIICGEVIKYIDYSILEGARSDGKQMKYFLDGKSKLDGIKIKSKHQVTEEQPLSFAIDIAPYPVLWTGEKAKARFYMLAGYMFMASEKLYAQGLIFHKLRWGGDWDSDKDFSDQSFDDLPHFELVKGR